MDDWPLASSLEAGVCWFCSKFGDATSELDFAVLLWVKILIVSGGRSRASYADLGSADDCMVSSMQPCWRCGAREVEKVMVENARACEVICLHNHHARFGSTH